jgi:glycosyltransferase involved in cell wall biosynthesis
MRILLSAFACQPGLGSEPGVGWNLATHLARENDVTVLTDVHNQPVIVDSQGALNALNVEFRFVKPPRLVRRPARSMALHYLYYLAWQLAAEREAARLNAAEPFDLIHHATYVNSWMPSLLGRLGAKFVWSEGTKEVTPLSFLAWMSWSGRAAEVIRTVLLKSFGWANGQITARRAQVILSSTPTEDWNGVPRVEYFPLGGLSKEEFDRLGGAPVSQSGPFRLVSAGRLLAWKGVALGIAAFQRVLRELPDSEYVIIGDGPERPYLERQAQELGVSDSVRFTGGVSREEVFQNLKRADVLVHPSLHEQFGYVVVEAMAAGRPAVCLDIGPFPAVVGDQGGFRIPRTSPAEVIDQLAVRLIELGRNRDRLAESGGAARAWALKQWSWEAVTERLTRLYAEVS